MNHYLLRRKYRIVTLILVTGAIYLCFQLFSFKVLNFSHHGMKYEKKHGNSMLLEDVKDNSLPHYRDGVKENGVLHNHRRKSPLINGTGIQQGNNNLIFNKDDKNQLADVKQNGVNSVDKNVIESKIKSPQIQSINKDTSDRIRGTHITQTEAYLPKEGGMFQCVQSKELIPYSAVNDDYCDCTDSSDEPGTSACPNSQFYCTFQYKDGAPQLIPGSRVGDGVCDCCDGSDEWQGYKVFPGVQLTDRRWPDTLTFAPCDNGCAAVEKANEEDDKIRQMGQRLKVTYIQAGRAAGQGDIYGPDNVFYKLSSSCFEINDSEYKYTLCPFKSVSQQKFPSPATNIGKSPNWQVKSHGTYVLKMEKGELRGCPGGRQRSTVITFICGLMDKIVKMGESEKCTYSMTFSTPAAC